MAAPFAISRFVPYMSYIPQPGVWCDGTRPFVPRAVSGPRPRSPPPRRTKLAPVRGADLIREARTRAGLTQDELAERSGRPRSLIARWEQGSVSPSIDNFLA